MLCIIAGWLDQIVKNIHVVLTEVQLLEKTGIFLLCWLIEGTILIEVVLLVFKVCFVKQEM